MTDQQLILKMDVTGFPIMNPFLRSIPQFYRISSRVLRVVGDADGRLKKQNIKELAFIHLLTSPELQAGIRNPFWNDTIEKKIEKLVRILDMPPNWKIDKELQEAIDLYKQDIIIDFNTELLDVGEFAAMETITFLKGIDYRLRDTKGNHLYKPKEVLGMIGEIGAAIDDLEKVRVRVSQGEKGNKKIRGGGEVGSREVPNRK